MPLTNRDGEFGLFIVDSTWRYADKMLKFAEKQGRLNKRSIPAHFRTAYPRRQEDCPDPSRGLASIEAVYIAYKLLGRDASDLLNNYYWKDLFISMNNWD